MNNQQHYKFWYGCVYLFVCMSVCVCVCLCIHVHTSLLCYAFSYYSSIKVCYTYCNGHEDKLTDCHIDTGNCSSCYAVGISCSKWLYWYLIYIYLCTLLLSCGYLVTIRVLTLSVINNYISVLHVSGYLAILRVITICLNHNGIVLYSTCINVTRPVKINHVSTNYTKLYFC